ncbi:MAG: phosphotransferase [Dehalococcoidia bacterium]|nr:phosphotransferase [Dehalococcoidia bacterium]
MRLPATLGDVTSEWLTHALRSCGAIEESRVVAFGWQVLGEGAGFIGQLGRITLEYDREEAGAPASVIGKFPSPIPQNRGFGVVAGLYETEIRFYHELAGEVGVRVPRCYFAECDPEPRSSALVARLLARLPGRVTMMLLDTLTAQAAKSPRRYALLMEDLEPARVGDQVAGCGMDEARLALAYLARLHATMWDHPALDGTPWLRRLDADSALIHGLTVRTWPTFVERYRDDIPSIVELGRWLDRNGEAVLRRMAGSPRTLLHGDYRLDNVFFHDGIAEGAEPVGDSADAAVTVIDWQAVRTGNPMIDVAYFLRPNVSPECAEASEEELVRRYHDVLVAHGVRDYSWEQCWDDHTVALVWLAMQGAFLLGALDLSHERGVELIDRAVGRAGPRIARIDLSALQL